MGDFVLGAASPIRPVEAIDQHPEGGADAAAALLAELFPDEVFELQGSGELLDGGAEGEDLVATFGPSLLIWGQLADELTKAPGRGERDVYYFTYSTAAMAGGYECHRPEGSRTVYAGGGAPTIEEGELLPFERPYWDGQRNAYAPDEMPEGVPLFDTDELFTDAALWMFGYDPSGSLDRVQFDPSALTIHRFQRVSSSAPASAPDVPVADPTAPKRRWWHRR